MVDENVAQFGGVTLEGVVIANTFTGCAGRRRLFSAREVMRGQSQQRTKVWAGKGAVLIGDKQRCAKLVVSASDLGGLDCRNFWTCHFRSLPV